MDGQPPPPPLRLPPPPLIVLLGHRKSDLGLLWSREEVGYSGLSLELGLIEFIFIFLSETVRKGSQGDRDGAGAGAYPQVFGVSLWSSRE